MKSINDVPSVMDFVMEFNPRGLHPLLSRDENFSLPKHPSGYLPHPKLFPSSLPMSVAEYVCECRCVSACVRMCVGMLCMCVSVCVCIYYITLCHSNG